MKIVHPAHDFGSGTFVYVAASALPDLCNVAKLRLYAVGAARFDGTVQSDDIPYGRWFRCDLSGCIDTSAVFFNEQVEMVFGIADDIRNDAGNAKFRTAVLYIGCYD